MRRHLFPVLVLLCLGWLIEQPPRKVGEVGHDLRVASVSPDGSLCVGLRYQGEWSCAAWRVETGEQLLAWTRVPDGPATYNPFAWSPDGKTLVLGTGPALLVWDRDFKRVRRLKADPNVRDVRFSGDVLMARTDHSVLLYRAPQFKMFYRQAQSHLLAARLSRDASTLALCSFQEPIVLFDVRDRKAVGTLPAGPATVNLEFCNQDRWLACAFRYRDSRSQDLALVYDWRARRALGPPLGEPNIMGFAVSEDGTRLLTRSRDQSQVRDPESGRLLCRRATTSLVMDALRFDGERAATVEGSDVIVWSPENGHELARLPFDAVPSASAFPGGKLLGVTAGSQSVFLLP